MTKKIFERGKVEITGPIGHVDHGKTTIGERPAAFFSTTAPIAILSVKPDLVDQVVEKPDTDKTNISELSSVKSNKM